MPLSFQHRQQDVKCANCSFNDNPEERCEDSQKFVQQLSEVYSWSNKDIRNKSFLLWHFLDHHSYKQRSNPVTTWKVKKFSIYSGKSTIWRSLLISELHLIPESLPNSSPNYTIAPSAPLQSVLPLLSAQRPNSPVFLTCLVRKRIDLEIVLPLLEAEGKNPKAGSHCLVWFFMLDGSMDFLVRLLLSQLPLSPSLSLDSQSLSPSSVALNSRLLLGFHLSRAGTQGLGHCNHSTSLHASHHHSMPLGCCTCSPNLPHGK